MVDKGGMGMHAFKNIIQGLLVAWPLYALIIVVVIGKFIYRQYELNRLSRSGIDQIDTMDGKTFEKYLEALFIKLGYRVERTRYVGDYGADLVTAKNGVKTIIQAKRYQKNVGVKAIQEAVAAKGYYDCEQAMVVTNSFYTKQAIELAQANKVQLWDRNDLVKALLSIKKPVTEPSLPEVSAAAEPGEDVLQDTVTDNICAICCQPVTEKVAQYCRDHSDRFEGKIYCFTHQKKIKAE